MKDAKSPYPPALSPSSTNVFSDNEVSKPIRIKFTSSSASATSPIAEWKTVARQVETDIRIRVLYSGLICKESMEISRHRALILVLRSLNNLTRATDLRTARSQWMSLLNWSPANIVRDLLYGMSCKTTSRVACGKTPLQRSRPRQMELERNRVLRAARHHRMGNLHLNRRNGNMTMVLYHFPS